MTPLFWVCMYLILGIMVAEIGVSGPNRETAHPMTYPVGLLLWPVALVIALILAIRRK